VEDVRLPVEKWKKKKNPTILIRDDGVSCNSAFSFCISLPFAPT
jgi:hypothetical protein